MHTREHIYYHDKQELHGFIAYDPKHQGLRPGILVAHDWSGRNQFAEEQAVRLAKMGYLGFAIDMYGLGKTAETIDEKKALMQPLLTDRQWLGARIAAAFQAIRTLPEVDKNKIAAIGFCFGGLCVLDLARAGTNLRGVVSFHGLLNKDESLPAAPIVAKILVLHGFEDPMVKPSDVLAFCEEMTKAQVDWQVHQYGHAMHAFTNPLVQDATLGTVFNATASKRSFQAMADFFEEIL